jgi:hypothetical protein
VNDLLKLAFEGHGGLREVTREIRPDWDVDAPGLRAAWQAGDKSMHHPYQQADRVRQTA